MHFPLTQRSSWGKQRPGARVGVIEGEIKMHLTFVVQLGCVSDSVSVSVSFSLFGTAPVLNG